MRDETALREFGMCLLRIGVRFHILQRAPGHLFFSLVSEQCRSIFQAHPTGARHFNSHRRRNIVDAARSGSASGRN